MRSSNFKISEILPIEWSKANDHNPKTIKHVAIHFSSVLSQNSRSQRFTQRPRKKRKKTKNSLILLLLIDLPEILAKIPIPSDRWLSRFYHICGEYRRVCECVCACVRTEKESGSAEESWIENQWEREHSFFLLRSRRPKHHTQTHRQNHGESMYKKKSGTHEPFSVIIHTHTRTHSHSR